jgi:hypothetical protein
MSDKSPFNLPEATLGVGLPLSGEERLLLGFALDRFGEPLTKFLLAGLGDEEAVSGRLFTVTVADTPGALSSRNIRVRADYRPDIARCLPRRKEPLVVLALLWLLMVGRRMSSFTLSYHQEEVLGLLGWEDTRASQLKIDEAVKRYISLYYEWSLGEQEMEENKLSSYEELARFISGRGCETIGEAGEVKRVSSYVEFGEVFVREMLSRSLFGINWDGVSSVERVTN